MAYHVHTLNTTQEKIVQRVTAQLSGLEAELNVLFPGRANLIKATLLALATGENIIVYGPGGTAKTLFGNTVLNSVDGATAFRILMNAQTMPIHLIGAQVLNRLDEGVIEYNVEHSLVTSDLALIDEYGNANAMSQTALNMVLNERVYLHGVKLFDAALCFAMALSNLEPHQFSADPRVKANLDRFIFKIMVTDLTERAHEIAMLESSLGGKKAYRTKNHVHIEDLKAFHQLIHDENFIGDTVILSAYLDLVEKMEKATGINYTNRSMVKILQLLEAIAFFDGQPTVELEDLTKLECVFTDGHNRASAETFRKEVTAVIKKYEGQFGKITDATEMALINQLRGRLPTVTLQSSADELLEAFREVEDIKKAMSTIKPALPSTSKELAELQKQLAERETKVLDYIMRKKI